MGSCSDVLEHEPAMAAAGPRSTSPRGYQELELSELLPWQPLEQV
jgi:hypothetical protein